MNMISNNPAAVDALATAAPAVDNSTTPAVQINNLSKSFGGIKVLDNIQLTIPHNTFFGLLGPNGAGKTTLIGILGGLVRSDAGSSQVHGFDIHQHPLDVRANIGIVPQELTYDVFFTVRESLVFQSKYYGLHHNDEWIDLLLDKLQLTDKANANTRQLSGGMKRRLMIAQALVHQPPIIVLDEPTAGVDINLRLSLWEFIREFKQKGHTIILTTHYLEEAEALCDEIALLDHGKIIAQGNTRDIIGKIPTAITVSVCIDDAATLPPHIVADSSCGHQHTFKLNAYSEIENLLAQLRTANIAVTEVSVAPPSLEDAFVQMVSL